MNIIEKNEGRKIPCEVIGNKICFDDDLTINLAKREQDWPVHIDICSDADGELCIGAAAGRSYVAEIDIPARQYQEDTSAAVATLAAGEDNTEEHNDMSGENGAVSERTALPLDMDKVTLTLWAID